jgi:hypothetical protein
MESKPESGNKLPPQTINPNMYGHRLPVSLERPNAAQRERDRMERAHRARNRLAFILAMAHGAVELSLRREPRRVRQVVKGDLDRRYGFKAPRLTNPIGGI